MTVAEDAIELPPGTASSARARVFVCDVLTKHGLDDLADRAALLTSEIATNAIRHASTTLTVRITMAPGSVRISVTDDDPTPPRIRDGYDAQAEEGRGLFIVQSVADAWGYEPDGDGKSVWFELATG